MDMNNVPQAGDIRPLLDEAASARVLRAPLSTSGPGAVLHSQIEREHEAAAPDAPPPADRAVEEYIDRWVLRMLAVVLAGMAALAVWVVAAPAPMGRPDGRTVLAFVLGGLALLTLWRLGADRSES